MREEKKVYKVLVGKPEGRLGMWSGFVWLRIGTGGGLL
jgi:hypothetical protein